MRMAVMMFSPSVGYWKKWLRYRNLPNFAGHMHFPAVRDMNVLAKSVE
jgi:hypothetical protein